MTSLELSNQIISLNDTLEMFTKKFTNSKIESQDLVQETILKALLNKNSFKKNTNLKGWLFTIMRNTFINKYRKEKKFRTITDEKANLYHLNIADNYTFNTPDGSLEYKYIQKCIDNIEEKLLIPFKLFQKGFKYHEISVKLELPIGTVKNRIFNAKKEIQKELDGYNP